MAFSSDPTLDAQWNALAGQTGDDITAQRQALASQNEAYQTNQNIQNMFNQGQTSPQYTDNYYSDPSDIAKFSTNSGQTNSTYFPTTPPPTSPLVDMRGGQGDDVRYGPLGPYTSEGTPILTSVTPPSPLNPLVDTRNMLRNDVLYGPLGPYTSEGTPLIVGGANQITSPLASMSSMQQPQGMIQGQAMSPDIQANFPTANTTYDPTKTIGDQIKALTSLADRQALLNNYGDYQTNQNIQGLYGLNKANADTFLKYSNADKTGKTTNAFEQALMANPKGANALLQSFNGTGSNPLLGQYNVLPGGSILPYQGGVPTFGMAGTPATNTTNSTTSGSTTSGASTSVKPLGILGTSTLIPGFQYPSSDASNTQPPVADYVRTNPTVLKSTYGITNPALLTYIASEPKLRDVDIKNLSLAFNSKTPEEVNALQDSSSNLNDAAYKELRNREGEMQRKIDIANPNSWLYSKNVYDPTKDMKRVSMNLSQYNQDNQYSSLLNPTTLSPSASLNELQNMYKNQLDVYTDPYGLKHVNTTNGIYTFDKTGKPIGFNLPSSDYRSQVQQTGTPNNLIDKYGNFSNKYNKV
jgi:hypothetical protein